MKTARILSASCGVHGDKFPDPADRINANRAMILECMERAAAYQPDFVCFPEIALHQGVPTSRALPMAETLPGPTSDAVSAKARALKTHVIFCLIEREGDCCFNTAALIGRDGGLIGRYRKYNATGYEMKDGIRPGSDVPVWQTDAGRVGCAICFDLKFPQVGLALSRGRAQIVFWPSMFYGGRRLAAWAMDYGFHLVRCHASGSMIVDPTGAAIAGEGTPLELQSVAGTVRWTHTTMNADHRTYHIDFHREKIRAIEEEYGGAVTVQWNQPEGTFNLASNLADVTVDDIERRFELQDLRAYLDEADAMRRDVLGASAADH